MTHPNREQKKALTRERIVRAAIDLFEENGYSTTTLEQVIAESGVPRRTFFRYFPSKESLLFSYGPLDFITQRAGELLEEGRPALDALLEAVADAAMLTDPPDALTQRRRELRRSFLGLAAVSAHYETVLTTAENQVRQLLSDHLGPEQEKSAFLIAATWRTMIAHHVTSGEVRLFSLDPAGWAEAAANLAQSFAATQPPEG